MTKNLDLEECRFPTIAMLNSSLIKNTYSFSSHHSIYDSYCMVESKTQLFRLHNICYNACFALVHIDVWGNASLLSRDGYKYFGTFIDDFSHYTRVYSYHSIKIKIKKTRVYSFNTHTDVFRIFKSLVALAEIKLSTTIKILRSYSRENISHKFQIFLNEKSIKSQRSYPHTRQQNGIAKRKNKHILVTI